MKSSVINYKEVLDKLLVFLKEGAVTQIVIIIDRDVIHSYPQIREKEDLLNVAVKLRDFIEKYGARALAIVGEEEKILLVAVRIGTKAALLLIKIKRNVQLSSILNRLTSILKFSN